MGGQVYLTTRFYLYGDTAEAAAQAESAWRTWLEARFPMATEEPAEARSSAPSS